jgi:hypothetical protein
MVTQLFWYRNAYKATKQAIKREGKNAFWQGMPLQFIDKRKNIWTFGFWLVGESPKEIAEHRNQSHKAGFLTKKVANAMYLRKKPARGK